MSTPRTRRSAGELAAMLVILVGQYMKLKMQTGFAAGLYLARTGVLPKHPEQDVQCAYLEGSIDALSWACGNDKRPDGQPVRIIELTATPAEPRQLPDRFSEE